MPILILRVYCGRSPTEQNLRFILTSETLPSDIGRLPQVDITRRALILYTSGTTGKPKGVVTTHENIQAQVTSLITAWEWTSSDRILHVLPLHHIHGIINVLTCALWAGAECHMLSKFDAEIVWQRICDGDLTLFMAVPTIYVKLIAAWEAANSDTPKKHVSRLCQNAPDGFWFSSLTSSSFRKVADYQRSFSA